jgi:hypothetical protein
MTVREVLSGAVKTQHNTLNTKERKLINNTLTKPHKFKSSNSSANPLVCDECHDPKGFKQHQNVPADPAPVKSAPAPSVPEKTKTTKSPRLTSRGTRSLSVAIPDAVFGELQGMAKPTQSASQVAKEILLASLGYEFVEAQPARRIAAKPAMYRKRKP